MMKNLRRDIMLKTDQVAKLFWKDDESDSYQRKFLWEPLTHPIWHQVRGQVGNSVLDKVYFEMKND